MTGKVIVIDNGGCTIKAGYSGQPNPRRCIPNALARGKKDKKLYVGDKIYSSNIAEYILTRPSQRGLVLDWECQKIIWENGLFVRDKSGSSFNVLSDAPSMTVVLTTAACTPAPVKRETLDVLFNDYRFYRAVLVDSIIASQFSPTITGQFTKDDWQNPCGLLVEVGFSAITVMPVFNTQPIPKTTQRLSIGGRILNNLLRERLAYLQVDLDDNPLLIQHIKEVTCEVARPPGGLLTCLSELKAQAPRDVIGYVLPDFETSSLGFRVNLESEVPTGSQAVKMGADRFTIPEAIFNPQTFGLDKIGIVDLIVRSVQLCDESIRDCIASKIIVSGGTAMMPNFLERLQFELEGALRTVAPGVDQVRLIAEPDGRLDLCAWRGASQLATDEDDLAFLGMVSRDEWKT
jgi:actin-related protein 6